MYDIHVCNASLLVRDQFLQIQYLFCFNKIVHSVLLFCNNFCIDTTLAGFDAAESSLRYEQYLIRVQIHCFRLFTDEKRSGAGGSDIDGHRIVAFRCDGCACAQGKPGSGIGSAESGIS